MNAEGNGLREISLPLLPVAALISISPQQIFDGLHDWDTSQLAAGSVIG